MASHQDVHTTRIVDLRSDTKSQPTPAMRQAMYDAILGDDVQGEDPTVNELERRSASLLGKEAALFVPTGTMANLISIIVHCNRRGSSAIVGHLSHNYLNEQVGASHIVGVQIKPIPNKSDGTFCLNEFAKQIGVDESNTTLALVENTHNMCGGKVIPMQWLDAFTAICASNGIATHMDGARLFNAAIYLDISAARIVRDIDTVTFSLSKTLCAPVGSMLLGTETFIRDARRIRRALGGGMHQAGVLAAAGLVALDTIVPRLMDDHRRMYRIAQAIANLDNPLVCVDVAGVHTNICLVHMIDSSRFCADQLIARLQTVTEDEMSDGVMDENGNGILLRISRRNEHFGRIMVYPGVNDAEIELAIKKIVHCIKHIVVA